MARTEGIDKWGFPIPGYVAPPPRVPLRGPGSSAHCRTIEGLRELCARQSPGETFTRDAIAEACHCTEHNIRIIEKRALKKMHAILGPAYRALLRDRLNAAS